MKKTIITALAFSLILALTAGCGGSPDDGAVSGVNEGGSAVGSVGEASTVAGTSDTANAGTNAGTNTGTNDSGVTASKSGTSQTSASKPSGGTAQNGGAQPSASSQLESAFVISTEYAEIHYPEKWDGTVTTKVEKDSVGFYAGKVHLFDLLFNGTGGHVVGTIIGENKNTVVRVVYYDIPEGLEDSDKYYAMQEDINVVIEYLNANYNFVNEEITDRDKYVFGIETPVVTLYYPAFWNGVVTVDKEDGGVKFSCGGTGLFDVVFDSEEGFFIGTYKGTKISIITHTIAKSSFSAEEFDRLCTMQEDVNVVIQQLYKDPDFKKK